MVKVWERAAPLIRQKKLRAIFLECSYTDAQKQSELYGHLNPRFFMQEMNHLARLVDPDHLKTSLIGLDVVVTHIKERLIKDASAKELIEHELTEQNDLGINLIFPDQGQKLEF